jgi:hypothetical protein
MPKVYVGCINSGESEPLCPSRYSCQSLALVKSGMLKKAYTLILPVKTTIDEKFLFYLLL